MTKLIVFLFLSINLFAATITSIPPTTVNEDSPYLYNPTTADFSGSLTWSLINPPSWLKLMADLGNISTELSQTGVISVAVDSVGDIYYGIFNRDSKARIYKKDVSAGTTALFAGNGTSTIGADGSTPTLQGVRDPSSIVIDGDDNLFYAERNSALIRMIPKSDGTYFGKAMTAGKVYTIVGGGADTTSEGIDLTSIGLIRPWGIDIDSDGNLFIAINSPSSKVKMVPKTSGTYYGISMSANKIYTIAGTGTGTYGTDSGVLATSANIGLMTGISVDDSGNVYTAHVATNDNVVRMLPKTSGTYFGQSMTANYIYIIAGTGAAGSSGDGGLATSAQLNNPHDAKLDSFGNLYIADRYNHSIRVLYPDGKLGTVVGTLGTSGSTGDGAAASSAKLYNPYSLVFGKYNDIYIADFTNNKIRKVVAGVKLYGIPTNDAVGLNNTTLRATDGTNIAEQSLSITVANTNDAPTDIALSSTSVAENAGADATVGTLSATDVDVGDSSTFTLVSGTGDTDNTSFNISGTTLRLNASADYETKNSYSIRAKVTDSGSATYEKAFTISITNVNEAPTNIALSSTSVAENAGANATVGTLSVTDVDSGDSATFTLVSGSGDTDNASFNISGTTLRLTASADYETKNSYSIRVKVTDSGSATYEKALTITITDVAEASFTNNGGGTSITLTPNENQTATTTITTTALSGTVNYTLSGADAGSFSIDSNGILTFNASPDYETKNSYSVTVTASNGTDSITQTISLNVKNVNDAPTFTNNGTATLVEGGEYSYIPTVNDADGDVTSIIYNSLPSWLAFKDSTDTKISTFAGSSYGYGGDGSVATSAKMKYTSGIVADRNGNVFIADRNNHRIRKVASDGTITTYAGNGIGDDAGDNGAATSAKLEYPMGLALDSSGNLYIADYWNAKIRKVDTNGTITTVAGSGNNGFSGDNGPAVSAKLSYPTGVAVDKNGVIYIADSNNYRVRKVDVNGTITTIAGNGSNGYNGDDILATSAKLSYVKDVAVDEKGNVYLADYSNCMIRKVDTDGYIRRVAGSTVTYSFGTYGSCGSSGDGGYATSAKLNSVEGVYVDGSGKIYIADPSNNKIRMVDANGKISTIAGTGTSGDDGDGGTPTSAKLNAPIGVTVDHNGIIYIADSKNNKVKKISSDGLMLAGTPTVSGVYDVNLSVTDGDLNTSQNYQITVSDVNDAPVLNDVAFVVGENNATGSTVGTVVATDEDGISPSVELIGHAEVITYFITAGNTNSDFAIDSSTGVVTIANALNAYSVQNYSLTIKAQDDSGASDSATISISVSDQADAPVAVNDSASVDEDNNATINLVSNDTDRDSNLNSGSVIITSQPIYGSVKANANGTATYSPTPNYNGTDSFKYRVSDATALQSNEANVTITINAVNDAPVATNQTVNTNEDTNRTIGLYEYVRDVDNGDTLTYGVVANPSHGTATISDNIVSYAPTLNFYGFDSFTYRATDGNSSNSNTATININVAEVNDIPIANNDYENNTTEDTAFDINVLANDTDDGDLNVSSVAILNQPSHGSAIVINGVITYKPDANWYGNDSFEYTVQDDGLIINGLGNTGALISNAATVTINVSSVNDAPIAVDDSFTLNEDNIMLLNLHVNDTDVDGDLNGTAITIVTQPTHGEANVTESGLVRYIPTKDYFGSDSFTYKISDGEVNSSTTTVSLTINAVNDAPSFSTSTNLSVAENTTTVVTLSANDVEGDAPITYSIENEWDYSKFSINGSVLSFNNAPDYENPQDSGANNVYEVVIVAKDSTGRGFGRNFLVTVTDVLEATFTNDGGGSAVTVTPNENQTAVTTVTQTGISGNITYTLSGTDSSSFSINSSGVLTFNSSPDYETKSSYSVVVTVSNGTNNSSQSITVNVTNVNEAPSFTSTATTIATENSAYTYALTVGDIDGDLTSISGTNLPDWLSLTKSNSLVSTFAGSSYGFNDAQGVAAKFYSPSGVVADSNGNLYVADTSNNKIRKIDTSGNVTTFAGSSAGYANGQGSAAKFKSPSAMAIDSADNIYVADTQNFRIRKIDTSGNVTTLAGSGQYGSTDGTETVARFSYIYGIAVDSSGNTYVADNTNNRIRKIATTGVVTTYAGSSSGYADGLGTLAKFNQPYGVAVDSGGNVYVADYANAKIRKIDTSRNVTTIAGSSPGYLDAQGTAAKLRTPAALSIDSAGNMYVSEKLNNRIRKIDTNLNVSTVAGTGSRGNTNGNPETSKFNNPVGITVDSSGNVYVADTSNHTIRKIVAGALELTGTPTVSGVYDINLSVTDGSLSTPQNYQITVADVNDAPVLNNTTFVISENNATLSHVGTVTAYDEDGISPSVDLIGHAEVITYSILAGNTNSDFAINSTTGEITIAKDLNAYVTSTYSLVVKAQDDSGASDTATISITVSNQADTPVAVADTQTLNEDGSASFDILGNDTDKDNNINKGSIVITKQPSHGSVQILSVNNGFVTYTPNANYYGGDYFSYKVYDATSLVSNEANATITVTAVNDAPVATNQTRNTDEDTNTTILLREYVIDVDNGDTITYSIVTAPTHGSATISDGIVSYDPDLNFYGFDSFTYKANDGTIDSNTATININVAEINDIPVANNDYDNNTTEDNAITINVLANDTDDNGLDSSSVAILNAPAHGTAVANNDGTITYTPNANWYGQDSFEYTVQDTGGADHGGAKLISNSAFVSVNVSSVNDAPIAVNDSFTLDEDSIMLLNPHANDTDVDDDLNGTAITIVTQPTHGEANVTEDGFVRYIPTKDYNGVDSFTYKISDGDVNSSVATVSLTINAVNDAPSISSNGGGGTASISIVENITAVTTLISQDVESNTITYSIVGGADSSKFSINSSSGVLTFSSAPNYESATDSNSDNIYVVEVNATDNGTPNKSDTQTISVTVTDVFEALFTNNGGGEAITLTPNENQTSLATITTTGLAGTVNYTLGGADAASFSVNSSGVVTFNSAPDYENQSTYTVTVTATGTNGNITQTVTANVANANDAPTISSIANYEKLEDFADFNVTFQIADVDMDDLNLSVINSSTALVTTSLVDSNPIPYATYNGVARSLTLDSVNDVFGKATIQVVVKDGNGSLDMSEFNLSVPAVIDSPNLGNVTNGKIILSEDFETFDINLTTIDFGGQLSVDVNMTFGTSGVVALESNKTVLADNNTTLTLTSLANVVGSTTATVTVSNGSQSATINLEINVTAVNDAPIISGTPSQATENIAYSWTPSVSDIDNPSADFSFSATNLPSWASINATNGTISGTPSLNDSGTFSNIVITVNDGNASSSFTTSITVSNSNQAPTISVSSVSVAENQTAGTTANATDPDNDTITFSISGTDAGLFNINSTSGVITFKVAPDYESPSDSGANRVYDLTVTATDTSSATDSENITVTITNFNESEDGSCGSSNGQTFTSTPNTNLCSVGFATSVTLSGSTYSWSCNGTTVGSDAGFASSCSATYQVPPAPAPVVTPPVVTPPVVEPTPEPETPVVEPTPEPEVPNNEETLVSGVVTLPATNDETATNVAEIDTGVQTQAPQTSQDGTNTTIQMTDANGISTKVTEITTPTDVTKIVTSTGAGTQVDLESASTQSDVTINNNGTIDAQITNKDTGESFNVKSSALGTDINVNEDGSFELSVNNTDVVGQDVKVEDVNKNEQISESKTTLTSDGSTVEAKVVIKTIDPLTGVETITTKTIDAVVTANTKVSITNDGSIQLKEESINSVKVIDPNTNALTDANVNSLLEIKPDGTTIHVVELKTASGVTIQTSATSSLAGSKTETTDNGVRTTATATTHVVENGLNKEVHVAIEVSADKSGKATHSMSFTNDAGESIATIASSELVGASTAIDNNGKIETSIKFDKDNVIKDINVIANIDGSAEHVMKFKSAIDGQSEDEVTTRATFNIVGAETKIKTTGGVETTVNDKVGEFTIKAVVETDTDGNSITKFEKYDSQGNLIETQKTTQSATLFEPGNKVIIEKRDGKTVIDTTAKVSGIIEF